MRVFTPEQYFTRSQSDARYVRLPTPPSAPTGLTLDQTGIVVTATEQYAFLQFILTPPPGAQVEGYEFEFTHPVSSEAQVVLLAAGGPYRITGLDQNTTYSVRARAVDFYGQRSAYTTAVPSLTASDTTAPATPTILAIAANRGARIKVSVLNTEPDFNHYRLFRGQMPDGSDFTQVAVFLGDTFNDQAIPLAGDYYYRARAYDSNGNFSVSAIVGPVYLQDTDEDPPSQPDIAGGSIVANSDGSITVNWPGNSDANLAQYRVWRKRTSQSVWSVLTILTAVPNVGATYTDVNVVHGVSYDYSVSAINGVGDESGFDQVGYLTAVSSDTAAPNAPTSLTYQGGPGHVRLDWVPSTSVDVILYEVSYRLTQVGSFSAGILVSGTSFALFGLTDLREVLANQLEFRVRARDGVGNFSSYVSAVVTFPNLIGYQPADATVPPSPFNPTATPLDDGTIQLEWDSVNVPDRRGYRLDRYLSDIGIWEHLALIQDDTLGTKVFTDRGLEPFSFAGRTHRYSIRTIDNSGNLSSFNYVENSSFENSLANWSSAADAGFVSAVVTTPVRSGTKALRCNYAGRTFQTVPVTVGRTYIFSAYVREESAPGTTARIRLSWRNASNGVISELVGSVTTSNSYLRMSTTPTAAPAGAVTAVLTLEGDSGSPTATFFYEDCQFEDSLVLTSYGDGKTGAIRAVDLTGPSQTEGSLQLAATAKLGAISLRWKNGTAKDFIESVYEVWRSTTSGGTYAKIVEVPGNDDGADNGYDDLDPDENTPTTYYYKLKARDRYGNVSVFLNATPASATSLTPNDVDIVVVDVTPPAQPNINGGSATANNDGSITLVCPANSEADLDGYVVWRRPSGGSFAVVAMIKSPPSAALTYIDPNLVLGITYEYTVSAFDKQGNESTKDTVNFKSATAADSRAPAAPTSPLMTGGLGRIECAWTASNFLGVERYEFEYSVNNGSSWSATEQIAGTSKTVFGLSQTSTFLQANFKFRVRAIGRGGTVGSFLVSNNPVAADMLHYRPADGTAPAAPTGFVHTTEDNGDVTFVWNANSESDLFGYRLERQYNGGGYAWVADIQASSSRAYRDVGLEPYAYRNRAYDFRLYAIDNSGNLSTAATISAVRIRDLAAPSQTEGALALSSASKIGAIDLSWNNGTGFDFIDSVYEIWRSTTGVGGTYSQIGEQPGADGGSNGWTDQEPDDQTAVTWHYKLKVRDRWGNTSGFINATGVAGTSKTAVLIDTTAPATPTGLVKESEGTELANDGTVTAFIELKWDDNNETDLDHYELQYYLTSATTLVTYVTVPLAHSGGFQKHVIRGLRPGAQYEFKVLAADKQNNKSAYTSALSNTMPGDGTAPSTPTISARSFLRGIVIVISSPNSESDFARYDLYRNTSNNSGTATKIAEFSSRFFIDESATAGDTFWYWVKAVDRTGNASSFSTGVSATAYFIQESSGPRLGVGRTPSTYPIESEGDIQATGGSTTRIRIQNRGASGRHWSLCSM